MTIIAVLVKHLTSSRPHKYRVKYLRRAINRHQAVFPSRVYVYRHSRYIDTYNKYGIQRTSEPCSQFRQNIWYMYLTERQRQPSFVLILKWNHLSVNNLLWYPALAISTTIPCPPLHCWQLISKEFQSQPLLFRYVKLLEYHRSRPTHIHVHTHQHEEKERQQARVPFSSLAKVKRSRPSPLWHPAAPCRRATKRSRVSRFMQM